MGYVRRSHLHASLGDALVSKPEMPPSWRRDKFLMTTWRYFNETPEMMLPSEFRMTSNWHPNRTTNVISQAYGPPSLDMDFQYIVARNRYIIRDATYGKCLQEVVEFWDDVGWAIGDERSSIRHINFGPGAPSWTRWAPDVIGEYKPAGFVAVASEYDRKTHAPHPGDWAQPTIHVSNAFRDHGIVCEYLLYESGAPIVDGHRLKPTLTTFWSWSNNAQEWCLVDATKEQIARDMDACTITVASSPSDKYACNVPWRNATYADVLPNAPPPPIGRPTPTKEMLKQMAAERDKLKSFPKPSGGTASDTSGSGKVPWAAIGIGAAAVGGLGLLWWAGRRS